MAERKTKATDASVEKFIDAIGDETARDDCRTLLSIMRRETQSEPRLWGSSIIGFGQRRYKYTSGRELDWFEAGFSPRKQNLVLYLMGGLPQSSEVRKKLGKFSTGQACLYIKKLADVDAPTLTQVIRDSIERARAAGGAETSTTSPKQKTAKKASPKVAKQRGK
jgi:hypothetical protein